MSARLAPGLAVLVLLAAASCGVDERADFLIGRRCARDTPGECDPGQSCLPHAWSGGLDFDDYRCRDEASFSVRGAPQAFCAIDPCPGRLVCRPDRVRIDAAVRPLVCKPADDPFGPPYDGGV